MKTTNLLKFLNNVHDLFTLDLARCDGELVNFLDLMTEDEQFTKSIDLGLVFVNRYSSDQYTIVDGLGRFLSLSLLLHAICECYKKTTQQNENAIKTIRSKYLLNGKKPKLHLGEKDSELYLKIINGERLSGHEKTHPMFVLLHNFWTQIKEEQLKASKIFTMLQKINITLVETDDVNKRDLYYKINSKNRELNQLALIDDYVAEKLLTDVWEEIKSGYFVEKRDIEAFLKDFFITKFNYKTFNPKRLYESFVNYFETMLQYVSQENLMNSIRNSAMLYYNILNLNFASENIKRAFIEIKKHDGADTYAYILNVYEDFNEGRIDEPTFIEILTTIDEYLKNRQKSGKNIDFNELVQYLNAFITCK